jgi:hypothetical protein
MCSGGESRLGRTNTQKQKKGWKAKAEDKRQYDLVRIEKTLINNEKEDSLKEDVELTEELQI